jgi:hypothetical protein
MTAITELKKELAEAEAAYKREKTAKAADAVSRAKRKLEQISLRNTLLAAVASDASRLYAYISSSRIRGRGEGGDYLTGRGRKELKRQQETVPIFVPPLDSKRSHSVVNG